MNRKKISKKLKAIRGNKPVEEVALFLGVTSSAVMMYERGERIPKDNIKLKYSEFSGKSVQSIFFD